MNMLETKLIEGKKSWREAVNIARDFGTGWRLPLIREIKAQEDLEGSFWTGMADPYFLSRAWCFEFGKGASHRKKEEKHKVLLVKEQK